MKKFFSLALALSLSLALLAGCGGSVSSSAADNTNEGTTSEAGTEAPANNNGGSLSFAWWGGDSRHEATIEAVRAFETANGVDVAMNYGAWSGWEELMSTSLYAGTAQDVIQANFSWLYNYGSNGTFVDLNDYAHIIDLTQFDAAALEQCTVDGELRGIPIAMTGRVFYWNATTFAEAGLEVPKTIDDLYNAGEVFATELGSDYYPLYVDQYDRMILMVWYLECKYGKNWTENNVMQYSEEEIIEGLEWINSLEEMHVIPSIPTITGDGADTYDKNQKWMDGRYAGVFEWDSAANKVVESLNEGMELVVGDYPTGVGAYQGGYTKVSMAFAITSSAADPELAAQLIQYMLNEEEGVLILNTERGIPASSYAFDLLKGNDMLDPYVAEANTKALDWCDFALDIVFENSNLRELNVGVYYEVFDGLSYGDTSVEDAAQILITGYEKELSSVS